MYIPADFRVDDPGVIRAFLEEHPFGVLAVNGTDGLPLAAHLPFLVTESDNGIAVEFHLAHMNELADFLENDHSAMLIVNGAHGYVSSSVYTHVNVPTYNYQAVHLSGTISVLTSEELHQHLQQVVSRFETGRSEPIDFAAWPQEMIARYMQEIKGVRLTISKTEAAFKLSQNRNETDFERIVNDIRYSNPVLAAAMQNSRKPQK